MFFEDTGIFIIDFTMGDYFLLFFYLIPKYFLNDGFILLYKLIKGRFFSIKDGSYNSIQTDILQYILNNILNAVITHALTNNIQLYQ